MAAQAAAARIKKRLIAYASETYKVGKDQVAFLPNRVRVGNQEIPFPDLAKAAFMNRVSLSSTGFYKTPKIVWDRIKGQGRPFFYFAYGAAVTEVHRGELGQAGRHDLDRRSDRRAGVLDLFSAAGTQHQHRCDEDSRGAVAPSDHRDLPNRPGLMPKPAPSARSGQKRG